MLHSCPGLQAYRLHKEGQADEENFDENVAEVEKKFVIRQFRKKHFLHFHEIAFENKHKS
jgi:hypothetical protein